VLGIRDILHVIEPELTVGTITDTIALKLKTVWVMSVDVEKLELSRSIWFPDVRHSFILVLYFFMQWHNQSVYT